MQIDIDFFSVKGGGNQYVIYRKQVANEIETNAYIDISNLLSGVLVVDTLLMIYYKLRDECEFEFINEWS